MSWDDELPTCLYCKHSDRHCKLINFREGNYPYYTWGCTNFGCECKIYDTGYIKKMGFIKKREKRKKHYSYLF